MKILSVAFYWQNSCLWFWLMANTKSPLPKHFSIVFFTNCRKLEIQHSDLILVIFNVTSPWMVKIWASSTIFLLVLTLLGIKIGCWPCILPKHWYNPSSLTFTLSCFWFILNDCSLCRCSTLIEILLLANSRLCRCSILIVMLILLKYRLCMSSVVIETLLHANYRLCSFSVLIEKLLLSNHMLCRCSILTEMLLLPSCRLCKCRFVIATLLLVDYRLCSCCVVTGIWLLESFRLCRCRCSALILVCYHCRSLLLLLLFILLLLLFKLIPKLSINY